MDRYLKYLMKKGRGGWEEKPRTDQEALCGDGDAVNRQRILTIAATLIRDAKGRARRSCRASDNFRIPHGVKNLHAE